MDEISRKMETEMESETDATYEVAFPEPESEQVISRTVPGNNEKSQEIKEMELESDKVLLRVLRTVLCEICAHIKKTPGKIE